MRKMDSLIVAAGAVALLFSSSAFASQAGSRDPEFAGNPGHHRIAGITVVPSDQGFGGMNMSDIPWATGAHNPLTGDPASEGGRGIISNDQISTGAPVAPGGIASN